LCVNRLFSFGIKQGCTNDDNPFGKARYRVAGAYLEFFGAITRTYSANKKLAFVLPEELRPAQPVEVQTLLDLEENTAEAMLLIATDGNAEILSLARYRCDLDLFCCSVF
jgi:hypothetical protein